MTSGSPDPESETVADITQIMAVPTGNIVRDINCRKDSLHFAELHPDDCSDDKTSSPVLSVFERLVVSDVEGLVARVSYDLIDVPYARTDCAQ